MILVFPDDPKRDLSGSIVDAYFYKDMKSFREEIVSGKFSIRTDECVFILQEGATITKYKWESVLVPVPRNPKPTTKKKKK